MLFFRLSSVSPRALYPDVAINRPLAYDDGRKLRFYCWRRARFKKSSSDLLPFDAPCRGRTWEAEKERANPDRHRIQERCLSGCIVANKQIKSLCQIDRSLSFEKKLMFSSVILLSRTSFLSRNFRVD